MRALSVLFVFALTLSMSSARAQDADPPATGDDDAGAIEQRIERLERQIGQLAELADALKRELAGLKQALADQRGGDETAPPAGPETLDPELLWSMDLKSDLKGSGAIADVDGDGKPEIVFGSYFNEERLFCVNAEDGSVVWTHQSDGGPLDASVAIDDLDGDGKLEVLAADSSSGNLFCVGHDGKLKFTIKLPNSTDSPPAIADINGDGVKEIIAGSMWRRGGVGSVNCYRADTQEQVWEVRIKGCVQSEPCLVDLNGDLVDDVIVTSWRGDRGVHALDGRDGKPLWTFTTPGTDRSMGMYHGVALAQTSGDKPELRVLVATCDGDIFSLDRAGQVKWQKKVPDYLFAPITVFDAEGDGKQEMIVGHGVLRCLSVDDGGEHWTHRLDSACARGAAITDANGDGRLDVLFADGQKVVALDAVSGKLALVHDATIKPDNPYERFSSAPLVADFDGDGVCEAFFVIGFGTSADGGKTNYGRAFALKLRGKGPEWTTFRGNLRRTGSATR